MLRLGNLLSLMWQIVLRVTNKIDDRIVCNVEVDGKLYSHKGINLPETVVSVPSITEHNWRCVDWVIRYEADFLAVSFVRSSEEVKTGEKLS